MQNAAYDFSLFEENARPEVREIRVVKSKHNRRADRMTWFKWSAVGFVLVALTCAVLYSHAQITALTMQAQDVQEQLSLSRSEYDYLSGVLADKTSFSNVESIAATELGLMKLDGSQITYVTLEDESTIVRTDTGWQRWWQNVRESLPF